VAQSWREWSQRLDRPNTPFLLALPEQRPIAAFYRQPSRREVAFRPEPGNGPATAEDLLRGETGWLIVPAARLLGREGRVAASVWLFKGDENSSFSLAAYRTLGAGEKPQPIVYRQQRVVTAHALTYNLLVKPVTGTAIRLALTNPSTSARGYSWSTPLAHERGMLGAGAKIAIEMPMPADAVGEIVVAFDPADRPEVAAMAPIVEFPR
jgi:hypothetical protein